MIFSETRAFNLFLAALVFLVILTSTFFVEFLFLSEAGNPSVTDNIIIPGLSSALLSTLLVVALFWRTRFLSEKVREQYVRQAREDLEKTLNTMTDFVSVHDRDFKVVKVNQALCEFLGKTPEEIIGRPCYRVFHDSDQPFPNCPQLKTAELDHPVTEIINDPKIGVPLQVTCSPFLEDGVFQGSLHVARVSEEGSGSGRKGNTANVFPICASCKSIRNRDNVWMSPEEYFIKNHKFEFTHTFCRECQESLYPDFIKK